MVNQNFSPQIRGHHILKRYLKVSCNGDEFVTYSSAPQGSNLGPLLFLVFTNDITFTIQHFKLLRYVDDLKLFTGVLYLIVLSLLITRKKYLYFLRYSVRAWHHQSNSNQKGNVPAIEAEISTGMPKRCWMQKCQSWVRCGRRHTQRHEV